MKYKCRVLFISVLTMVVHNSIAGQQKRWSFDPSLVDSAGGNADISLFNQGGQLPGTYMVDILLNGDKVDAHDVVFYLKKNKDGSPYLYPCINIEELSRYGVKTEKYPALVSGEKCADISAIPQASYDYQFGNQQLMLNIPQASLRPKSVGIAPVELWDDGINAALMNYSASINRFDNFNDQSSNRLNSSYVQLSPGINVGPWRMRNQTSWKKQGDGNSKWETVYTYADRGINKIKSRITLGDRYTPGDVFDSIPFRGVMLGSDDDMIPWSQRAFAPIVRGIAHTQATVEVRQNGYIIYNTTVAPGPFALSDLITSGSSSGDLQVFVKETDGTTQVFTVPYQTPAVSVKEGYLSYNVMTGKYRPSDSSVNNNVGQATVIYGLPWNLTVYGGIQSADHYEATTFGLGWSAGEWGAISLDGSGSRSQRYDQSTETGGAWRLRYSKDVVSTNTTFTMASYQYASSGYNLLSDVMDTWERKNDNWNYSGNKKSSTTITLSQSLGDLGYINLNGMRNDYWERSGYNNSFGASYGTTLSRGISMTLGWSQNRQFSDDGKERTNRLTSLWFSIPLDRWTGYGAPINATYQLTSPSSGNKNQEIGLNGDLFERQLHWDVRQRHTSGDTSNPDNSAVRLNWYGTYAQLGGNYSYSPQQRQIGAQITGGVILHSHGATFGQPLGDNVALVEAAGASGIPVLGGVGVKTDFRGYATQDWLTPYQINTVSLDPLSLGDDIDIKQTDVKVIPTQGAIVRANFIARKGSRAVMSLSMKNGKIPPFGALAMIKGQDEAAGIVGQNGQIYLTGLPDKGDLFIKWDGGNCNVQYQLKPPVTNSGLYNLVEECM